MAKQITLELDDKTYTLEYNRDAVQKAEQSGFDITRLQERLTTNLELLFHWSFHMHHRFLKPNDTKAIYQELGSFDDVLELTTELADMYQTAMTTLSGTKKAKWTKSE